MSKFSPYNDIAIIQKSLNLKENLNSSEVKNIKASPICSFEPCDHIRVIESIKIKNKPE